MRRYDTRILSTHMRIVADVLVMMEDALRAQLGGNMRRRRLELDVSQERCAEVAQLHRTYYAGVERGERNPTFDNLVRIAFALEVTPSQLLDGIVWRPERPARGAGGAVNRPRVVRPKKAE